MPHDELEHIACKFKCQKKCTGYLENSIECSGLKKEAEVQAGSESQEESKSDSEEGDELEEIPEQGAPGSGSEKDGEDEKKDSLD